MGARKKKQTSAKLWWTDAEVDLRCSCGGDERTRVSMEKPRVQCDRCGAVYDLSISVTCHRR